MSTKDEHKAILSIGYRQFVMDAKSAAVLFTTLTASGIELYEDKWNPETKVSEPCVAPVSTTEIRLGVLAKESYAMGKLLYAASLNKQGETK
jgi:hypothetical protein